MPVLGEKVLGKRFLCEFCKKTFRTRQGLSGHMHFKHLGGGFNKKQKIESEETTEHKILGGNNFKIRLDIAGIKGEEKQELQNIWANWYVAKALFEDDTIKFDAADRKNYLLTAFAISRANKMLLANIRAEFATISEKLKN